MPADKKKGESLMKNKKLNINKKLYHIAYIVMATMMLALPKIPVLASSTTESVNDAANKIAKKAMRPINIINVVIVSVIAGAGVFVFLKGLISEFIPGIQGRDVNTIIQGVLIMLVGILMIFLKTFLKLAGIAI